MTLMMLGVSVSAGAIVQPDIDTPENRAILSRVEQVYNAIKTVQANFAQFNSKVKDDLQTGTFYLSKPGQMRLVYEKGSPLEFYATNGYLIYHDKELKEVSYFDLAQTPVEIILQKRVSFDDKEFRVTYVADVLDEYFVTVEKAEAPELGNITLVIDKETLSLKQWDVVDMQGIKSTVSLYNIKQNIPVDKSLFSFHNPYQKKGEK